MPATTFDSMSHSFWVTAGRVACVLVVGRASFTEGVAASTAHQFQGRKVLLPGSDPGGNLKGIGTVARQLPVDEAAVTRS